MKWEDAVVWVSLALICLVFAFLLFDLFSEIGKLIAEGATPYTIQGPFKVLDMDVVQQTMGTTSVRGYNLETIGWAKTLLSITVTCVDHYGTSSVDNCPEPPLPKTMCIRKYDPPLRDYPNGMAVKCPEERQ